MAALVESYSEVEIPAVPAESLPNDSFKRVLRLGDPIRPYYTVKVLDEQILSNGYGTVHIRQFILGHHSTPSAINWKKHIGWQGKESIRELYRRKIEDTDEVLVRELDVSRKEYVFS